MIARNRIDNLPGTDGVRAESLGADAIRHGSNKTISAAGSTPEAGPATRPSRIRCVAAACAMIAVVGCSKAKRDDGPSQPPAPSATTGATPQTMTGALSVAGLTVPLIDGVAELVDPHPGSADEAWKRPTAFVTAQAATVNGGQPISMSCTGSSCSLAAALAAPSQERQHESWVIAAQSDAPVTALLAVAQAVADGDRPFDWVVRDPGTQKLETLPVEFNDGLNRLIGLDVERVAPTGHNALPDPKLAAQAIGKNFELEPIDTPTAVKNGVLEVSTGCDRLQIGKAVRARLPQLHRCYQAAYRRDPALEGVAKLQWTIDSTGSPVDLVVNAAGASDPDFVTCVRTSLVMLPKIAPSPGTSCTVTWDLKLERTSPSADAGQPLGPVILRVEAGGALWVRDGFGDAGQSLELGQTGIETLRAFDRTDRQAVIAPTATATVAECAAAASMLHHADFQKVLLAPVAAR